MFVFFFFFPSPVNEPVLQGTGLLADHGLNPGTWSCSDFGDSNFQPQKPPLGLREEGVSAVPGADLCPPLREQAAALTPCSGGSVGPRFWGQEGVRQGWVVATSPEPVPGAGSCRRGQSCTSESSYPEFWGLTG